MHAHFDFVFMARTHTQCSFVPSESDPTQVAGLAVCQVEWVDGAPVEVAGTERVLPADLVVLAMGFVSPEQTIAEQLELATDARDNVLAEHGEFSVMSRANGTPVPGVFAAGDCRRGQSLVVWAINEGRGVADAVDRYLAELEDAAGHGGTTASAGGL